MYFKIFGLSALASAILIAVTPMLPSSMSTDNGGTKSAIDAYSDGGGVVIINQAGDTKFDNSAMNSLVFKYGEEAKTANTTLKNQVNVLSTNTSAAEKAVSVRFDLAKVVINPPVNGTSCDDGNPQTITDVWSGGLCAGNNVENQGCQDGDQQTIDDKYHNGVCAGTNVEGVTCDDTVTQTINDVFHNGVCMGKMTTQPSCADTLMVWNASTNLCEKTIVTSTAGTLNNSYSCPSGGSLSGTTCLNNLVYSATQTNSIGYDGCEGGTRNYSSAVSYCASKGMRLPITSEIAAVPSCGGWTRLGEPSSASTNHYTYYTGVGFRAGSFGSGIGDTHLDFVRCAYNTTAYSCPSGGVINGSTCILNQDYSAINNPYYTCPSGGIISGTNCLSNVLVTATGTCQQGYVLSNNQCVEN